MMDGLSEKECLDVVVDRAAKYHLGSRTSSGTLDMERKEAAAEAAEAAKAVQEREGEAN